MVKGSEGCVLSDQTNVDTYSSFVVEVEPRLRRALTATFGPDIGREAAEVHVLQALEWRATSSG
jgi:hypothetical protein